MDAPRRILVVKLGAVGDVVHTLFAVEALRDAFPRARIGWAVEDKSADLLAGCPLVDELFVFRRRGAGGGLSAVPDFVRVARALARFSPDLAIDFQTIFKSGLLTRLSGAPRRIGFDKWREGNFLFTNERTGALPEERHAVQKYFALLRLLGIPPATEDRRPRVRIAIGAEQRRAVDEFLATRPPGDGPAVAVNPGASWPTKRWPPERYGEVARALAEERGAWPVVIWGPGEREDAETVVRASGNRAVLAPPTTIREVAYLLSRCDAYLGGDTGPMHIAAAVNTPAVALFAPSDPARVRPWGVPHRIVEPVAVECHHCWERRRCPKDCIRAITVEEVLRAARALLAEVRR